MIMGTSTIQRVKLFVENIWKFKRRQNINKYYVDQQEAAVLSYSAIVCPELMIVDFYMKKKLISGYSISNTLKECLKELSIIF